MKIKAGDKVRIKTRDGDGVATVTGVDPVSGTYQVNFEQIKIDDGAKRVEHKNLPGYVPGSAIRRE